MRFYEGAWWTNMYINGIILTQTQCFSIPLSIQGVYLLNKKAQRALGRSPEEKVKGQGEAII